MQHPDNAFGHTGSAAEPQQLNPPKLAQWISSKPTLLVIYLRGVMPPAVSRCLLLAGEGVPGLLLGSRRCLIAAVLQIFPPFWGGGKQRG